MYVCIRVYVHAYVFSVQTGENYKQICERPLLSPSQDRDPDVSGLYEITVKWLHTRVGNPCIDMLAHRDTQIGKRTRRHRKQKQYTNIHRFICRRGFGSCFLFSLSACRRILVVVVRAQIYIPNRADIRNLPTLVVAIPKFRTQPSCFAPVPPHPTAPHTSFLAAIHT